MGRFVLRRLGAAAVLLWVVLTATFAFVHIAPGDPFNQLLSDPRVSRAQVAALRQHYGLDQPLTVQYWRWLSSLAAGDWGTSLVANRPASDVLAARLPPTLLLVSVAIVIENVLGVGLGLWAAARAGSRLDQAIRVLAALLFALPLFWMAVVAVELFTVQWPLFPSSQMRSVDSDQLSTAGRLVDVLHHVALPALVLGVARCGAVVRLTRNGLVEVLAQDYIRTARALGLPPRRILWVHALKNALGPLIQRLGVSLPILLSGSLIIEVVFSWPGLGQTLFVSILERDYPVILAATALSGLAVVLGSLGADLLHAWIDPRVRHG